MAASNVQQVISKAVKRGWIGLSIDTFVAGGGALSAEEERVLNQTTVEELSQLKELEDRIRSGAPGAAGDDGVVF